MCFTTKCETLPNKTLYTNIYKQGVKDTRKTTTVPIIILTRGSPA